MVNFQLIPQTSYNFEFKHLHVTNFWLSLHFCLQTSLAYLKVSNCRHPSLTEANPIEAILCSYGSEVSISNWLIYSSLLVKKSLENHFVKNKNNCCFCHPQKNRKTYFDRIWTSSPRILPVDQFLYFCPAFYQFVFWVAWPGTNVGRVTLARQTLQTKIFPEMTLISCGCN